MSWSPQENDDYFGAPHEPPDPDTGWNSTARKVVEFCTARGLVEEAGGDTVYSIPERMLAEFPTEDEYYRPKLGAAVVFKCEVRAWFMDADLAEEWAAVHCPGATVVEA